MTLTLYVFDFHEVWVPHLPRAYSILKDSTNINSGKFSWSYFYFILHLSVSSIIILQFLRVQQLQYVLTLNNPSKKNLFHSYSHFPVFFLTGDVFFYVLGHILFSALQFSFSCSLVISSKVSYWIPSIPCALPRLLSNSQILLLLLHCTPAVPSLSWAALVLLVIFLGSSLNGAPWYLTWHWNASPNTCKVYLRIYAFEEKNDFPSKQMECGTKGKNISFNQL